MQIKVNLLGKLRLYLPEGGNGGAVHIETTEDATPATLLQQLKLPEDEPYLVLVNDEPILPEEVATLKLQAEDEVTFCPPIRGGNSRR